MEVFRFSWLRLRICFALVGIISNFRCETWSSLTASNLMLLERAHRFFCKNMQELSIETRIDVALTLLNKHSIESETDLRKLISFGQYFAEVSATAYTDV